MKYYSAASLLALGAVAGKISHPEELRKVRTPKVGECKALCIFENNHDQWCFQTTPPMLKVGWEWEQTFKDTETTDPIPSMSYYRWDFAPYVDAQVYLQSLFNIENLYFNEFVAELKRFKMDFFLSVVVNANFYICPGAGWGTEAIDFKLTMQQKLMDCYKTLLEDLCDFSDSWTGYEAKWFEECDRSNNAQIILFEETFYKETTDKMIAGTVNPWSKVYCKPMPGIYTESPALTGSRTEPASSRYAKLAYKSIANYFTN